MFQELSLNFLLAVTSSKPESGAIDIKPDMLLYATSQPSREPEHSSTTDATSRVSWTHAVAVVEVKTNPAGAPLNFDKENFALLSSSEGPLLNSM